MWVKTPTGSCDLSKIVELRVEGDQYRWYVKGYTGTGTTDGDGDYEWYRVILGEFQDKPAAQAFEQHSAL